MEPATQINLKPEMPLIHLEINNRIHPWQKRHLPEVLVFRNQFVQQEAKKSEPKNGNENFL